MNELSIGVGVHCDEHTTVKGCAMTLDNGQPNVNLQLANQGYSHAIIYLNAKVAAAIHQELERCYPELAVASEPPIEVIMHYADSHAHEVAPTADEEIAAMVAELADSPNARKFGSTEPTCRAGSLCSGDFDRCGEQGPFYLCTRRKGHTGQHIACSYTTHNLQVWANEGATTNAT